MTSEVAITLKNYRCFADTLPATIELGPGFTALLGPNNSGKSAYLKFFYEFQPLWQSLLNLSFLVQLANHPTSPIKIANPRSVVDVQEILSDYTGRPLALEIRLRTPSETEPYLDSIALKSAPKDPTVWLGALSCPSGQCHGLRVDGAEILDHSGQRIWTQPFRDFFEVIRNCMFAPAFRNAINEGAGSYYDLAIGTSLVALWNEWKAGDTRASKIAIQRITGDIRHIFGFDSLEINASANARTFDVVVDGRPYRLNDLGAGLSQFIILFANIAIKKPALLLLDEPELNLHPSLQVDFLTSLASYTSTGSVVFATHSIGLARAVADRIFTFSPSREGTTVSHFERTPNYAEFAGELSFSSFRELGFSSILMVEGPSEVKAVQQLLRLLRRDHEIVVLHLGGEAMICPGREHELGELKRITNSVAVLIDSERMAPGADVPQPRKRFLTDCEKLGFKTHVTTLRAFENYLPEHAVKTIKGDAYRALAPYERLKDLRPAWAKAENWLIARQMTTDELLATDLGGFLGSL